MQVVKLAAGLAVGYVLGSRAGREKYEQILATVRKAGNQSSVAQSRRQTPLAGKGVTAPGSVDSALSAGSEVTTPEAVGAEPTSTRRSDATTPIPRSPRRKPSVITPGTGTTPLA